MEAGTPDISGPGQSREMPGMPRELGTREPGEPRRQSSMPGELGP